MQDCAGVQISTVLGRRGNPRIPCFANEVLNLDCEPHGGRSYFMGLTSPRPSEESVPSRRSLNICPGQENEDHSEQPSAGSLDFLNNTDFGDQWWRKELCPDDLTEIPPNAKKSASRWRQESWSSFLRLWLIFKRTQERSVLTRDSPVSQGIT